MPSKRQLQTGALAALAIAAGVAVRRHGPVSAPRDRRRRDRIVPRGSQAIIDTARRLNRASGLIATSTLLDSAIEHYRGSFHNKAMITPLVASALTIAVSVHGTGDRRSAAHRLRDSVYLGAALTGLTGTGFHI